jgi:tetratricopeptide (TPR) repeat protein/DNA-binding CsgD family transcriptional regulator
VTKKESLFNTFPPKSAWLLLTLAFFASQFNPNRLLANGETPAPQNIFEQVIKVPKDNRVQAADSIYKAKLRHVGVAVAMESLNRLQTIAENLDDKPLICAVFDMRSDYYSVNVKFNPLSTDYLREAIDYAASNKMPLQRAIYLSHLGRYYFTYKRFTAACKCYLKAQQRFREIGFDKVPGMNTYFSEAADLYYAVGDFASAKTNLLEALQYARENNRDKINIINTIGLIYRNDSDFEPALDYFKKAITIATANKDTVWVGIITGNIGAVYFLEHQYKKALPYIIADYQTSITHGEPVNGAMALLRLTKIDIDAKNFTEAGRFLKIVDSVLVHTTEDVLVLRTDYNRLQSDLNEKLGNIAAAMAYLKTYDKYKDSVAKRNDIAAIERVSFRYEMDVRNAEINKMRDDSKILTVEIDASVAVLVLLAVISVLVYNRQRLKSNRDKEMLRVEKQLVDDELKSAEELLRQFTENLRLKNMLIEKSRLEIVRLSKQSAIDVDAGHLENMLKAHIMTDENWSDFRALFSKVYPGFFVNLKKNYPHLSATDTRMLALLKLGLNNAEMSNMIGITIEGIKKGKQRLRKKMNIENFQ